MTTTAQTQPVSDIDATVRAGFELLRAGRIPEAEKVCRNATAVRPTVQGQLLASAIAEARSDFPQALEIVTSALEQQGEHAELLLKQAQLLMQLRRRREGIEAANRAAEICPPDARLLHAIAKVHLERGEPADAKPLLQRARELAPARPGHPVRLRGLPLLPE